MSSANEARALEHEELTVADSTANGPRVIQLTVGPYSNEIYLVSDPASREAWIIDAGYEPERVAAAAEGLRVQGILITHGHHDHHEHLEELRRRLGVPAGVGEGDAAMLRTHPDFLIRDGVEFRFGRYALRAIHTPGHTPGSTCFLVGRFLFTGDTLFPGGPGNTRTPTGNFELIIQSIRDRLFTLPDETLVYPGHGRSTTIGAERPHLEEWVARGW